MNIVDSIGVALGGDASEFDKMLDAASQKLLSFQGQMSNWSSSKFNEFISGPIRHFGKETVNAFAAHEKAVIGLEAQLKGLSSKPFLKFANEIEEALGKDDTAVVAFMTRLTQMGIKADKLKGTTLNAMGFGAATGMGDFMAFRALQQFKQGQMGMMGRYIPTMRNLSRPQQELKVQELINNGFRKMQAEQNGVAGSYHAMTLAIEQNHKAIGEMIANSLRLPEVYQRITGFVRNLTDNIHSLTPATRKWIIVVGAVVAAFGPVNFMLNKMLAIMDSLARSAFKLGATLFTKVMPALILMAGAFMLFEFGKTLGEVEVGCLKISTWTELAIHGMMSAWQKYWDFVSAGFRAMGAEQELSKAYGNTPNMLGVYPKITGSTKYGLLGASKEVLDMDNANLKQSQYYFDNAPEEDKDRARSQLIAAKMAVNETLAQLKKDFPGVKDFNAPLTPQQIALERDLKFKQNEWLNPEDRLAVLRQQQQDAVADIRASDKDTPSITTWEEFKNKFLGNMVDDATGAYKAVEEKLRGVFDKWAPQFKAPLLHTAPFDASLEGSSRKMFTSALEFGSKEAYSLVYGNAGIPEKLLDATTRGADATEESANYLSDIYEAIQGGDGSIPSGSIP